MADRLIVRGAREHNLKDVSLDLPARRADRLHRAVRVRQVEPRLRHDLRRGPAALRRVPVGVRPPVPRPDGQARRRLHRGPVAGGLDRPEVDLAQPALDGRHDHRGLRLPAAALRPHRQAALPGLRPADRPADAAADRRPGARARRGHAASRCSRRWSAAARASTSSCSASCRPRASAGPGSTASVVPLAEPPTAEEAGEAHDRGGGRPAAGQGRRQAPADRLGRDRAGAVRRPGRARLRRPARGRPAPRAHVLRAPRLPLRRPVASRSSSRGRSRSTARSAPARPAPASAPGWRSTPSWSSRTRRAASTRARSHPWSGAATSDYFGRLVDGARRHARLPHRHRRGSGCRRRRRRRCSTGTRDQVHVRYRNRYGRERSYYTDLRGRRPVRRAPARARPRATPPASGSRATCARCRARPAAAARLKPVSLAVTVAGAQHRRGRRDADRRVRRVPAQRSS